MLDKEFEISFGSIHTTPLPQPFTKYVVVELMYGNWFGSNWLNETGKLPKLAIGGTHPKEAIVEIIGQLSLAEVLTLAERGGFLTESIEEMYYLESLKPPRKI